MQIARDIQYSIRLLRKTPGFTAITLLVLVSGFSLFLAAYAISVQFNKPVEFPNGDRYVALKSVDASIGFSVGLGNHDLYTYNSLAATSENYQVLGAFSESEIILSDSDYAKRYLGGSITPELLVATEVKPLLGSLFLESDIQDSSKKSTLLSHGLWQEYFGGDESILEKPILINDIFYDVIGVMPEGFDFPHNQDLWFPLYSSASVTPGEGARVSILGILNDDASFSTAGIEIKSLLDRLVTEYPEVYTDRSETAVPFALLTQASISRLTDLDFIVMFVTLIIVALTVINLSSLLFIRSSSRNQELALRLAVGGNGWNLAKQVLTESFVICLVGLILSIGLGTVLVEFLKSQYLAYGSLGMASGLRLNFQVVSVGFLAMLAVWVLSGLHIAIKAFQCQPDSALTSAEKGSGRIEFSRAFSATVFLEVILSCFLLIFCGYMLVVVNDFRKFEYGTVTENIVVGNVDLDNSAIQALDERQFYRQELEQQVLSIAGIENVAFTTALPGLTGLPGNYSIEDRELEIENQLPRHAEIWVSENYFEVAEVSLISGRHFSVADTEESENVVIITETLAQQLWPDSLAVGKRIQSIVGQNEQWLTVVGVISPILQFPIRFGTPPTALYRPLAQGSGSSFYIFADHQDTISSADLGEPIRLAGAYVNREIPIEHIRSLEEEMSFYMGDVPVSGAIFTAFAIATLVVAGIGIYGVIARSIALRTHEIGVRRALGSSEFKIIRRFLSQGFHYLLAGALVGIVPAIILISIINSTVNFRGDISMTMIYVLVLAMLGSIISAASYIPARKAVDMDPGDALRYE